MHGMDFGLLVVSSKTCFTLLTLIVARDGFDNSFSDVSLLFPSTTVKLQQIKFIPLEKLKLDNENPRLPSSFNNKSENILEAGLLLPSKHLNMKFYQYF
jgi:hypothetical protein